MVIGIVFSILSQSVASIAVPCVVIAVLDVVPVALFVTDLFGGAEKQFIGSSDGFLNTCPFL